jgi:hypothetical protein
MIKRKQSCSFSASDQALTMLCLKRFPVKISRRVTRLPLVLLQMKACGSYAEVLLIARCRNEHASAGRGVNSVPH